MKHTIKQKLMLFCAGIMIFLIALSSVIVGITERKSTAKSFTENMTREAALVDTSIGLFLKGAENMVNMMAQDPALIGVKDNISKYMDITEAVMSNSPNASDDEKFLAAGYKRALDANPDYLQVFMGTKWGGYATSMDYNVRAFDPRERSWYKAASAAPGAAIITNAYTTIAGFRAICLSRACLDGGSVAACASVEVKLDTLTSMMSSIHIGKSGYMVIVQGDGTVLADPLHSDWVFKKVDDLGNPVLSSIASKTYASMRAKIDGSTYLVEVRPLATKIGGKTLDWRLVALMKEREAFLNFRVMIAVLVVSGIVLMILAAFGAAMFAKNVTGPLHIMSATLQKKDLTELLDDSGKDEIASLAGDFNAFTSMIRNMIISMKEGEIRLKDVADSLQKNMEGMQSSIGTITGNVSDTTNAIERQSQSMNATTQGVSRITKEIESLDTMIEEQVAATTEASSAVEEMIGNIRSMDKSTEAMSNEFKAIAQDTGDVKLRESAVNEKIRKVSDDSSDLGVANEVISAIAKQTNLLAMNAAIEAAHAGDAGKGFSVVADEIRKLAETSSEQSKQIGVKLTAIRSTIEAVVIDAAASGKAVSNLSDRITATGEVVESLRNAIAEQDTGSKQILEAVKEMSDGSLVVKTSSEGIAKGAASITGEVQTLSSIADNVRALIEHSMQKTNDMSRAAQSLEGEAERVQDAVKDLSRQIAQFKV